MDKGYKMNSLFVEHTNIKEIKSIKGKNGRTIPYFVFNTKNI